MTFSRVKITCYFHVWIYLFFAPKLTWYFIGVYIINSFLQISSSYHVIVPIISSFNDTNYRCLLALVKVNALFTEYISASIVNNASALELASQQGLNTIWLIPYIKTLSAFSPVFLSSFLHTEEAVSYLARLVLTYVTTCSVKMFCRRKFDRQGCFQTKVYTDTKCTLCDR